MTRPILVFGAGGRVGGELMKLAKPGWLFSSDVDITKPERVAEFVSFAGRSFEGDAVAGIVNLAACTLPYAEKPEARQESLAVNAAALFALAGLGVPLLHISTDCVFDGDKREPYAETDDTHPINNYGLTKRIGELSLESGPHIILRTTGVYLRGKPNFLEGVLAKAQSGEAMEVVADTLYTPTDARELARAILTATERVIEDSSVSGTYHFAGPDVMSYLDFARLVAAEAGASLDLRPTTAAEREKIEGFKRPKNAALNSDKFAEVFGLRHRPTRECVRELVQPR